MFDVGGLTINVGEPTVDVWGLNVDVEGLIIDVGEPNVDIKGTKR